MRSLRRHHSPETAVRWGGTCRGHRAVPRRPLRWADPSRSSQPTSVPVRSRSRAHSEWTHASDEDGGTSAILHVAGGLPLLTHCFACDGANYVYDDETPEDVIRDALDRIADGLPECLRETPETPEEKAHGVQLGTDVRAARERHAETIEARVEAAKTVCPIRLAVAQDIVERAKADRGAWRTILRGQGLPAPTGSCGPRQLLRNLLTGAHTAYTRVCGQHTCPNCADYRLALKTQMLMRGWVDVDVIGSEDTVRQFAFGALERPALWFQEVPRSALDSYLRRVRRAQARAEEGAGSAPSAAEANSLAELENVRLADKDLSLIRNSDVSHFYMAFQPSGGTPLSWPRSRYPRWVEPIGAARSDRIRSRQPSTT